MWASNNQIGILGQSVMVMEPTLPIKGCFWTLKYLILTDNYYWGLNLSAFFQ
jgi:hypothetical protein